MIEFCYNFKIKNITWEQAVEQDWRKTKAWKSGWIYQIEE